MSWPYSTWDEVSHLAEGDVVVLRSRIDQLIEERRVLRREHEMDEFALPTEWRLTPGEERFVRELVIAPIGKVVTKERLHAAFTGHDDPDSTIKLVDVICCKVRKRLPEGSIETVWGRGYVASASLRAVLGRS